MNIPEALIITSTEELHKIREPIYIDLVSSMYYNTFGDNLFPLEVFLISFLGQVISEDVKDSLSHDYLVECLLIDEVRQLIDAAFEPADIPHHGSGGAADFVVQQLVINTGLARQMVEMNDPVNEIMAAINHIDYDRHDDGYGSS